VTRGQQVRTIRDMQLSDNTTLLAGSIGEKVKPLPGFPPGYCTIRIAGHVVPVCDETNDYPQVAVI
jgi:hypothetical protein